MNTNLNELSQICCVAAKNNGHYDEIKSKNLQELVDNKLELLVYIAKINGIVSETVEVCDALKKESKETVEEKVSEEFADVIINALSVAGLMGIDLDKAVKEKLRKNESRGKLHGKRY